MSAFLASADVERLTGYKRASAQLAWCKDNGVQAWLSAAGEVIVPLVAIEGKKAQNDTAWVPDFSSLEKRA